MHRDKVQKNDKHHRDALDSTINIVPVEVVKISFLLLFLVRSLFIVHSNRYLCRRREEDLFSIAIVRIVYFAR